MGCVEMFPRETEKKATVFCVLDSGKMLEKLK